MSDVDSTDTELLSMTDVDSADTELLSMLEVDSDSADTELLSMPDRLVLSLTASVELAAEEFMKSRE